ncbi:DUF2703 domain-containing protein [Methanoculleus sp.]|nr:DUF2703 domain-containing protein [Methanoculleus sp.]
MTERTIPQCTCTVQDDAACRAVEYDGERYESIPPELIARAALKAREPE